MSQYCNPQNGLDAQSLITQIREVSEDYNGNEIGNIALNIIDTLEALSLISSSIDMKNDSCKELCGSLQYASLYYGKTEKGKEINASFNELRVALWRSFTQLKNFYEKNIPLQGKENGIE